MANIANFSIITIKSLELDNIKINEVQGSKTSVVTKGKIEICYSPEYDRFVLRLNNFKYALSKNIPVTAMFAPRSFRAYSLPTTNGHYILKLKTIQTSKLIQNFETIISNYGQLLYKSGQETELRNQAKGEGNYPNNVVSNSYTKGPVDAKIYNPNEFYVKTIGELKSPGNEVIDFPKSGFDGVIFLSNLIEKSIVEKGSKSPVTSGSLQTPGESGELSKKDTNSSGPKTKFFPNPFAKQSSKKEIDQKQNGVQKTEWKPFHKSNSNSEKHNEAKQWYSGLYGDHPESVILGESNSNLNQINNIQSKEFSVMDIPDYEQIPDEIKFQIENIVEHIKIRDMTEEEARLNISEKIIQVYPRLESIFRRDFNRNPNLEPVKAYNQGN